MGGVNGRRGMRTGVNPQDVIPFDSNGDFARVQFATDGQEETVDVDLTSDEDAEGAAETGADGGAETVANPAAVETANGDEEVGSHQQPGDDENEDETRTIQILQQGASEAAIALETANAEVVRYEDNLQQERDRLRRVMEDLKDAQQLRTDAERRAVQANSNVQSGERDKKRVYSGKYDRTLLAGFVTFVKNAKKERTRAENAAESAGKIVADLERDVGKLNEMIRNTEANLERARQAEEVAGRVVQQRVNELATAQRNAADDLQRTSEAETARLEQRARDRLQRQRQDRGITVGEDGRIRNGDNKLCDEEGEPLYEERRGNFWNRNGVAVNEQGDPIGTETFSRLLALYRSNRGVTVQEDGKFVNQDGKECDEDGNPLVETVNDNEGDDNDNNNDEEEKNGG